MSRSHRRALRAGALALATGTVVVAAGSGADAAVPTSYGGGTTTRALDLEILPGTAGLPTASGSTPAAFSLQLLPGSSTLLHDGTGQSPDAASSTVALLGGTLPDALATGGGSAANPTASSSLSSPGPNTATGLGGSPTTFPLAPLGSLSAPAFTATSVRSPLATSTSGAGVDLDVLTLGSLLPDTSALTGQIAAIRSALTALGTAAAAVPGAGDAIAALTAQLALLQAELTTALTGALLSVQGLQSSSDIRTVGSQVVSTGHVSLGRIGLFGGLLTGSGFTNTVVAKAGGTPGSASFTPTTDGGLARLSGLGSGFQIDGGRITAGLGALNAVPGLSALAGAATAAVQQLQDGLATLNSSLMGLVTITADTPSPGAVRPDGTAASGQVSGLEITISAPGAPGVGTSSSPPPSSTGSGAPPTSSSTPGAGPGPTTSGAASAAGSEGDTPTAAPTDAPTDGAPSLQVTTPTLPVTPTLPATPTDTPTAAPTTVPDPGLTPVLSLQVGAAAVAATASNLTTSVLGTSTTRGSAQSLAFTGADLPATGGIAFLLLAGGAAAAHRRRRTADDDL